MKIALNIAGGLLIALGLIWVLQGMNVVHGSPMSGHMSWVGWGAWALAFGAGLIVWNNRTPKVK